MGNCRRVKSRGGSECGENSLYSYENRQMKPAGIILRGGEE
jgi:hypothetical protein